MSTKTVIIIPYNINSWYGNQVSYFTWWKVQLMIGRSFCIIFIMYNSQLICLLLWSLTLFCMAKHMQITDHTLLCKPVYLRSLIWINFLIFLWLFYWLQSTEACTSILGTNGIEVDRHALQQAPYYVEETN